MKNDEPLVSVIMPAYNCEDFIGKSIESVLNQTYVNLELIITDDKSTDGTINVVREYMDKDDRVHLLTLDKNSGAAVARNNSIKHAHGIYLAFLDSDDIWKQEKLQKQIAYMIENDIDFCATSYGKIDEEGKVKNKIVSALNEYDYEKLLISCPGNSTIIYNCSKLGKVYGPDIRKRNDFALWLNVIKISKKCIGMKEVLSFHRLRGGSISINKRKLVKYQWIVYKDYEQLGYFKSTILIIKKIVKGLFGTNG